MTKRQANIYNSIKEAFEEVEDLQMHFRAEELQEIYEAMKEHARQSELTTIKQLAMLYALHRLC